MRLKFVTFSGANEHTDIDALISLLSSFNNIAEAGIQVSGKKAFFGSPRYLWIKMLHYRLQTFGLHPNLALHLNQDWAEDFCDGKPSMELSEFLGWKHRFGIPFFGRVQLNFRIGRERTPDLERLLTSMRQYPDVRFILSYNDDNAAFIHKLYDTGLLFDCLYDNSHGEGIEASHYNAPAFEGVLQGYSGGISPENVADVLKKISRIVPYEQQFFIDAEGKLKGDDGYLSYEKCRRYLEGAKAMRL